MRWLLLVVGLVTLVLVLVLSAAAGVRKVPAGHIGVVYRKFGRFTGAIRRVSLGATPGPLVETLRAHGTYYFPPVLYSVRYVPTTRVPVGTIGVVVAKDGVAPPADHTMSVHVDCDLFQDGKRFLRSGGQIGRQLAVLPGGVSYDINPELFDVLTVNNIGSGHHGLTAQDLHEIVIPVGQTGVVCTTEGQQADEDGIGRRVPGHSSFQLPQHFLRDGGQRGVQSETLEQGGVYRINPWFAKVVLIPTRDLILEWSSAPKRRESYDIALDMIRVNIEGYWIRFEMSQIIRIPAKVAPLIVSRFGGNLSDVGESGEELAHPVQRFVERVLGTLVDGFMQEMASEYQMRQFLRERDRVRLEVDDRIRQALGDYGVIAGHTTLGEVEPETFGVHEMPQSRAREREMAEMLEYQQRNPSLEDQLERIGIQNERDYRIIEASLLKERIALLGHDAITAEALLAQLKDAPIPHSLGDAAGLLARLPMPVAIEMINRVLGNASPTAEITSTADEDTPAADQ